MFLKFAQDSDTSPHLSFMVWNITARISHLTSKHSTTELHPQLPLILSTIFGRLGCGRGVNVCKPFTCIPRDHKSWVWSGHLSEFFWASSIGQGANSSFLSFEDTGIKYVLLKCTFTAGTFTFKYETGLSRKENWEAYTFLMHTDFSVRVGQTLVESAYKWNLNSRTGWKCLMR